MPDENDILIRSKGEHNVLATAVLINTDKKHVIGCSIC